METPDYSVIVPVYNSVETLEPLYEQVKEVMQELDSTFELIYVEDRGMQESWEELLRIRKKYPDHVVIIRLSKNFGQNGATLCGIDEARGKMLITIDDDMQTQPREIHKLVKVRKETDADVVYGMYSNKSTTRIRKWGTLLVKYFYGRMEGESIGSSFRLINATVARALQHHSHDHLFINQVISWYSHDIERVNVERSEREDGASGYSFFKLVGITFRLIFYYTSIPLKAVIALGFLASLACFAFAGYYIYQKMAVGAELGFTAIIVSVFVASAVIMALVSIMGVYINRMYSARVKKPHYSIKLKL